MATVSEIWVRVNADVKGLQSGLLKGGTELKAFSATANKSAAESTAAGSKIGGAFSGVSSTLNRLAPAFIAIGAVAVGAIVKGISVTTQWADQVRSLQRVTGQTAESASALAGAAAQLGIPVSALTTSFGLLEKNIVNGSAKLTQYGIATKDATGRILPFDDVLAAVTEKFASLPTAADKAAFAQNVFGRSGKALIPILQQGAAGLAALEKKAGDLHLVLSQKAIDDAEKLSIAERQLGLAFKGASISIGQAFIPVATTVVNAFTKMVSAIADIPQPIKLAVLGFSVLTGAIAATVKIGGFFADTWKKVLGVVGNTAQLDEAAQSATNAGDAISQGFQEIANLANVFTAVRGSTIAATAPIAAMGVAINSTEDAALAASLANTKFAKSASGLIVPTSELANASQNAAAGIGATSQAATGLTIGGAVTILGALAVAGGFVAVQMRDARGAVEQFASSVQSKLDQLRQGGNAAEAVRRQAAQPLPTQALPGSIALGGGLFQQVQDTKAAIAAVKELNQQLQLQTLIFRKLPQAGAGVTGLLKAMGTSEEGLFNAAVDAAGKGADAFTQFSDKTLADASKAWNDFRTNAVSALTFTTKGLGDLESAAKSAQQTLSGDTSGLTKSSLATLRAQAHVTATDILHTFQDATKQTISFGKNLLEIGKVGGQAGKDLANSFLQAGDVIAAQVVADAPKKLQDKIVGAFGKSEDAANTFGTKLTNAIVGPLDDISRLLGLIAQHFGIDVSFLDHGSKGKIDAINTSLRALAGRHRGEVDLDTSRAQAALAALIARERQAGVSSGNLRGTVSPRQLFSHSGGLVTPAGVFHQGGMVDWAHITHTPQFHAGGTVSWAHDIKPTKLPELTQTVRRMHTGGLKADEVPAVLQRGEFVVRKQAVQHLGLPTMRRINRMHEGGAATTADETTATSSYGVRPPPTRNGQMWMQWAAGVANAFPGRAIAWWNNRLDGVYVRHHDNPTMSVTANLGPLRSEKYFGYTDFDLRNIRLNPLVKIGGDVPTPTGSITWNAVLRHEMGHGFGLGHVPIVTNLMDKNLTGEHINSTQVNQIRKWFHPPTLHGGGLASDEVPAVLQRGEFVIRKHAVEIIGVPKLRELNRMHQGGAVAPALLPSSSEGIDEAAIERAFRRALRAEREKLYVDRRRFGRDLDQNVLTDGHW